MARLDWTTIAAMDEASLERRLLPAPRPSDLYAPADYGRIEGFYNRTRRHKHLDQLSPHAFERRQTVQ